MKLLSKVVKAGVSVGKIGASAVPGGSTALAVASTAGKLIPKRTKVAAGQKVAAGAHATVSHGGGGDHQFYSVGEKGKVGFVDRHGREHVMRISPVAHIGKNLPKHRQLVRLRHNLARHRADVRLLMRLLNIEPAKHHKRSAPYRGYARKRRYAHGS